MSEQQNETDSQPQATEAGALESNEAGALEPTSDALQAENLALLQTTTELIYENRRMARTIARLARRLAMNDARISALARRYFNAEVRNRDLEEDLRELLRLFAIYSNRAGVLGVPGNRQYVIYQRLNYLFGDADNTIGNAAPSTAPSSSSAAQHANASDTSDSDGYDDSPTDKSDDYSSIDGSDKSTTDESDDVFIEDEELTVDLSARPRRYTF